MMPTHDGKTLREVIKAVNTADVSREKADNWIYGAIQAHKRGKYRKATSAATIAIAMLVRDEEQEVSGHGVEGADPARPDEPVGGAPALRVAGGGGDVPAPQVAD